MNIWILAVYLQILDILTTLLFLAHGMYEINPLIRFFLRHFGPLGLLLVKSLAIIAICLIWAHAKYKLCRFNSVWVITTLNYLYAGVVVWNIVVLVCKMYGQG